MTFTEMRAAVSTRTALLTALVLIISALNIGCGVLGKAKDASSSSSTQTASLSISTTTLPNATQNSSYSANLSASGGTTPYSWSITGLPAGLTLSTSGTISGTPTTNGTFVLTAKVTDAGSSSTSLMIPLIVTSTGSSLAITTTSLPAATVGVAYSATLTATGGTTPYTWSSTGMPPGLSVSGTGVISGTPSVSGTFGVTATVGDAKSASSTLSSTVTVSQPSGTVVVTISPQTQSIMPGQSQTLTASVTGSTNTSVTYKVNGTTVSTSSTQYVFSSQNPGTYTISATANADTSKSASAVITVGGSGPRTYFVATNGNDNNDCTSDSAPCRTIARVLHTGPIAPGDTVRVHAGLYRERGIYLGGSGSSGHPITVQAFGDGEVIVDGSTAVTGWTIDSGNVYKATPGFAVSEMVVDNMPLIPAKPVGDPSPRSAVTINAGQFFYDTNSGILYLYTSSGTSPADHDIVALPSRPSSPSHLDNVIHGYGVSYWVFDGLTVRGASNVGIALMSAGTSGPASYNTVQNSRIWFNAYTGVTCDGDHFTATNNTVSWNMMDNWPRGRWLWGGWGGGLGANGGYATFANNTIYQNGGEGLISYAGPGHNVMSGNTVYSNWSSNIYIDNQPFDIVEKNLIYCEDPQPSWTTNNGVSSSNLYYVLARIRPMGIMTADEFYGIGTNMHDATLQNNIILNCRRGFTHNAEDHTDGNSAWINAKIVNNTVVTPAVNGKSELGEPYTALMIYYNGGYNSNTVIENNLFISQGTNYSIWAPDMTQGAAALFTGLTLDYNLEYNTSGNPVINWAGGSGNTTTQLSLAQWQNLAGTPTHGAHDVGTNPLLKNLASLTPASDKTLSSTTSSAYHAGTIITGLSTDYNDFSFGAPPSLGALEYGSTPKQ